MAVRFLVQAEDSREVQQGIVSLRVWLADLTALRLWRDELRVLE